MAKTKKFNPRNVKIFFSILMAVIFSSVLIASSNYFVSKIIDIFEYNYIRSCKKLCATYSDAFHNYLENYETALSGLTETNFSELSPSEIQKSLIKNKNKNHPDFSSVFYVDKTGIAYDQTDNIFRVMEREYFYQIINLQKDSYISNPVTSKADQQSCIIICKAIKNTSREIKGILCASVKLETLNSLFNKDDTYTSIILDNDGRFIVNKDSSWLSKPFTPENSTYRNLNSLYVVQQKSDSIVTSNTLGQEIRLTFTNVPETDWTFGIFSLFSTEKIIYEKQNKYKTLIILIGIASVLILIILEFRVTGKLESKQLIDTIYDPLTKIWTRQKFEEEATRLLHHNKKAKFMLVESDIRGFKFFNDQFGEGIADNLLIYYSKILNNEVIKYHGIMGRGFADHFYTLLKVSSVNNAMREFKKALAELNEDIKNYDVQFFPKFGISFLMPDNEKRETTIQGLIGQASFAKSTIKDNLITQYSIYNSKLIHKINEEQYLESYMETALEKHEFFVLYQPKISLNSEKIVGAEALVRWNNPKLGILSPIKFIPLFERNSFVTKLDFYVYEEVFKFLQKQISNGEPVVPISVNMSRNHSKPDKFMHDFLEIFHRYSIPPSLIQIEIIERSYMDNNTLKDVTDRLHQEGFTVAMDDFGTGESSLNMLTKIPVDVLKFDREFLISATNDEGQLDPKSAKFIQILIELSKNLEKETVFEGVETKDQRDFLKSINCDEVQGYFYSKPLTQTDFVEFIKLHS